MAATDLATLAIEIVSKGIAEAQAGLKQLQTAAEGTEQATNKVSTAFGRTLVAGTQQATPTLAQLRAELGLMPAQIDGVSQAAERSVGSITSFNQSFNQLFSTFRLFRYELLVNIGERLMEFVANLAEAGNKINSMAQQTGLGAQGFQGWATAATEAGGKAEDLTRAMGFLERANVAVEEGNPRMVKAFADLGLTWDKLKNMTPSQELMALAEGIQKAGISIEEFAIKAGMGRGGSQQLELLMTPVATLQKQITEAEKLSNEQIERSNQLTAENASTWNKITVNAQGAMIVANEYALMLGAAFFGNGPQSAMDEQKRIESIKTAPPAKPGPTLGEQIKAEIPVNTTLALAELNKELAKEADLEKAAAVSKDAYAMASIHQRHESEALAQTAKQGPTDPAQLEAWVKMADAQEFAAFKNKEALADQAALGRVSENLTNRITELQNELLMAASGESTLTDAGIRARVTLEIMNEVSEHGVDVSHGLTGAWLKQANALGDLEVQLKGAEKAQTALTEAFRKADEQRKRSIETQMRAEDRANTDVLSGFGIQHGMKGNADELGQLQA
jgi:hypothetical protein